MQLARDDIYRVLHSLIRDELTRLRGGQDAVLPRLAPRTPLTDTPCGVDSIEMLSLASAVSRLFHLHELGVEDWLLRDRTPSQWTARVQQALEAGVSGITFTTSGSTGTPKPCTHAWSDLAQEVEHLTQLFQGTRRVVSLVPPHHIYGFLFTVLLPRALGVPVLEAGGFLSLDRCLQAGDLIVAFPLRWSQLSAQPGRFPAGVEGVTSTAPCDPAIIEALGRRGLARVVEVYGSSETGGIGARDHPRRPYSLFPYWSGDGEWLIRRLTDGDSRKVRPPDRLDWQGERLFHTVGRCDGAVQVAGVNVFPDQIAGVLRQHVWVRDCAVRLMRPQEGERLKAFVVLSTHAPPPEEASPGLLQWLGSRLPAPQRPARLSFGPALPRNSLGKAADW